MEILNKIIRFSLGNRALIIVAYVLLGIVGLFTAHRMDVDVFPDLNAPTVVVMTEADGMAPEEVERLVTFPIETAVNGATDVRRVRSSSTTGFSVVWVEFEWDTDNYLARQIVSEKIATVRDQLPSNVGEPTMGPQSSILGEVMFVALTSDSTSALDLRTLADWQIRPRLMSLGGVAQVAVIGGDVKEYQIVMDPAKMRHHNVSLDDVRSVVSNMNRNVSGGVLYDYGNEYIVRGVLQTADADDLGTTPIKPSDVPGGHPTLLSDVAQVTVGAKSPRMGLASHNGKGAVVLTVTKQPNTSTIELSERIDKALEEIRASLPQDVHLANDIYRQERFIRSSINNVKEALVEGGIFVVVILFLFLMNIRTTVISLVTIPLSLVVSILTLNALGLTINTMSLGGMAIAIGSLVDDAIVDVENVFKRLRENRLLPPSQRKSPTQVVYEASREVRMPILNSTLIIIASFAPLFFLDGMEGKMLAPLGIAFITALCASTLVALTLTPVLCRTLLSKGTDTNTENSANAANVTSDPHANREPKLTLWLRKHYQKLLAGALAHKKVVLTTSAVALVGAVVLLLSFGRSFLPPFNEGSFTINVSTVPGIAIDESDQIGRQVECELLSIPEIRTVGRKTGRAELDEHALGVNVSEIEAPYELSQRSKEELMADIRGRLAHIPGISVEIGSPISHRIDAMLSGSRAGIAIKIFGPDLNKLFSLGNQIKSAIADVPGLVDLNVEQQVERPQLQIVPRRQMMARYGVTMPQLAQAIETMLEGETVSQVREGEQIFDLTLKVGNVDRQNAEQIGNLPIDAMGQKVPLSYLADIRSASGPNTINREGVQRKIVVSANVSADNDMHSAVTEISKRVTEQVELPEGYRVEYGGQFESEQEASRTLLILTILAIAIIFLLIYNQFRNLRESAIILLNLPLALIGGVVAVAITGGVLSIPAIIGFISLFGIATRNGMLLVSRYADLRRSGLSLTQSITKGSVDRLNPILMTALTSALALIPLVLGGELPGNEIQSPMAKVMLGGLVTSTLLNGIVVPVIYAISANKETNVVVEDDIISKEK